MDTPVLAPLDARGKRIRRGAIVRIVGLPDLSGIRSSKSRREVTAVFRHVRGQCKRVRGFSRYGFVEIFFRIRRGSLCGWHSIEIEPALLMVQKRRPR
jgi:hypothetical protein